MEQHGRNLALAHRLAPGHAGPAAGAAVGERRRPGRSLRPADRGGHGEPPHHAGRRVAARQFLPRRGADSHGQAALAQGVQPRTAEARERPVRRTSARLRPRVRGDLPRGRPGRRRRPVAFRGCLPDGVAAGTRRAVGHSHHAAAGADREPAPCRRPDRRRHDRPEPGRGVGRPDAGGRRARSEESHSGDRRHGALEPADGECVRRRAGAAAART